MFVNCFGHATERFRLFFASRVDYAKSLKSPEKGFHMYLPSGGFVSKQGLNIKNTDPAPIDGVKKLTPEQLLVVQEIDKTREALETKLDELNEQRSEYLRKAYNTALPVNAGDIAFMAEMYDVHH